MSIACAAAIFRWKILSKADRLICLLMIITVFSEFLSLYLARTFGNNMAIQHIFSPLELLIVGFYFHHSVSTFRKKKIGVLVAVTGIALAILTTWFLEPLLTHPTIFLLTEAFIIIILSLFSFFHIFYKEEVRLLTSVQFWISFIMLVFWSFTFFIWGTYASFGKIFGQEKLPILIYMILGINLFMYLSYFFIFLFYPKMIRSGE
jgi:hypothetical protein